MNTVAVRAARRIELAGTAGFTCQQARNQKKILGFNEPEWLWAQDGLIGNMDALKFIDGNHETIEACGGVYWCMDCSEIIFLDTNKLPTFKGLVLDSQVTFSANMAGKLAEKISKFPVERRTHDLLAFWELLLWAGKHGAMWTF